VGWANNYDKACEHADSLENIYYNEVDVVNVAANCEVVIETIGS
jgi:hypothetical protein